MRNFQLKHSVPKTQKMFLKVYFLIVIAQLFNIHFCENKYFITKENLEILELMISVYNISKVVIATLGSTMNLLENYIFCFEIYQILHSILLQTCFFYTFFYLASNVNEQLLILTTEGATDFKNLGNLLYSRITILLSQNISEDLNIFHTTFYSNTIIFCNENISRYNRAIREFEILKSLEDILSTDRYNLPEQYWPFVRYK